MDRSNTLMVHQVRIRRINILKAFKRGDIIHLVLIFISILREVPLNSWSHVATWNAIGVPRRLEKRKSRKGNDWLAIIKSFVYSQVE